MSNFRGYAPPGLIRRRCNSCGIEAFVEDLNQDGLCPLCEETEENRENAAYRQHYGMAYIDPNNETIVGNAT